MNRAQPIPERDATDCLDALARVADRVDPFSFVPRPGVTARLVTVGPFHLRELEYRAVLDASGSSSALLANATPDGEIGRAMWRVPYAYPFEHLKSDPDWDGISQSVVWDAAGGWLVVVSDEGHGVVAGPHEFVTDVVERLPHGTDALEEIVGRLVVGRPDTADHDAGVMAMIARFYGAHEADRIRIGRKGSST